MTDALTIAVRELSSRAQHLSALSQRFPALPGKLRAGRWLLRGELRTRDVIVTDSFGNRFVMPDLREPMAQHVLWNGKYEAEVLEVISAQLTPGDCFVDVGANIGLFTVAVARGMGNAGRVLAIEASPLMQTYLRANISLNELENVSVYEVAASDHAAGDVAFYDAPLEKFGMGSLAPQFQGNATLIPTQTLDALLDKAVAARVGVIKIDVEGFEAAVLRGATRLLTQPKPPLVLFEFMDWAEGRAGAEGIGAAQRVLRELEYAIWKLKEWRRGGPALKTELTRGGEMLVAARR